MLALAGCGSARRARAALNASFRPEIKCTAPGPVPSSRAFLFLCKPGNLLLSLLVFGLLQLHYSGYFWIKTFFFLNASFPEIVLLIGAARLLVDFFFFFYSGRVVSFFLFIFFNNNLSSCEDQSRMENGRRYKTGLRRFPHLLLFRWVWRV